MIEFLTPIEESGKINEDDIWNHLIEFVKARANSSYNLDPAHLPKYESDKRQLSKHMIERLENHDLDLALKILDENPSDIHRRYSEFLHSRYEQKAA